MCDVEVQVTSTWNPSLAASVRAKLAAGQPPLLIALVVIEGPLNLEQ